MLEILGKIGTGSVLSFWVPVLVWTGLSGVAALALGMARGMHPLVGYRLRQALLLALPAAVLAAPWVPALWAPTRDLSRPTMLGALDAMPPLLLPSEVVPAPNLGSAGDIAALLLGLGTVAVILIAVVRLAMVATDLGRLRRLRLAAPPVEDPTPHRALRELARPGGLPRFAEDRPHA